MYFLLLLVVLVVAYQVGAPGSLFRKMHADVRRRKQSSRDVAERFAELHNLSQPEREILRVYVLQREYEHIYDPQDAVVRRLIDRGILRPVPGMSTEPDASTFSVAAWTRSYLVSRPELLS